MPDFLTTPFTETGQLEPLSILIRLVMALVLGLLVAQVYRHSRSLVRVTPSFSTTLILLCVLIAMVTQVIGDNVARAFSLVGALSIVRFRTVVRDTEDTAYVIFAVVTGMAVGSHHLWTAILGIGVIAVAALWIRFRRGGDDGAVAYLLTLRLAAGMKPEDLFRDSFESALRRREIMSMATSRQGAAMEYVYEIQLQSGVAPDFFTRNLNRQEGVQSVEIRRTDFEV